MTVLLEARGLDVVRGERRVLEGVTLGVSGGEAVAVVGPNAAGKSTLLRALAGLLPVSAGGVRLCGRALREWPRLDTARSIALVAAEQDGASMLTVRERVTLGRYPHRGPFRVLTADDHGAVDRALSAAGITPLAERRVDTLSAGERQLAALARGLAQSPRVLLLDEPASHLDIAHQLRLGEVLDAVRAAGVAVLMVVHDLPRAAAWADRMILLSGGRVQADGPPDDVLGSRAAEQAFDVRVTSHAIPGLTRPLYTFSRPDR